MKIDRLSLEFCTHQSKEKSKSTNSGICGGDLDGTEGERESKLQANFSALTWV